MAPRKPLSDHAPTHDEKAEAAIIAAIFTEPEWLRELELTPGDFYDDDLRRLYETQLELYVSNNSVTPDTVSRAVAGKVEQWVIDGVLKNANGTDPVEASKLVRELCLRRVTLSLFAKWSNAVLTMGTGEEVMKAVSECSAELLGLGLVKGHRSVIFSNPIKIDTADPTYRFHVETLDGRYKTDVSFTARELDRESDFGRKIRNVLNLNPILPKDFKSLINRLVTTCKIIPAPSQTSEDDFIVFWVREWFERAQVATAKKDLAHGYIVRNGYRYFVQSQLLAHLSNKLKRAISASRLVQVLESYGYQDLNTRVSSKAMRLHGLPESFFEQGAMPPSEEVPDLFTETDNNPTVPPPTTDEFMI
ncbi:DnaB-like helicase N terminal domain-containing protein [Dehalogenimonas formicexedens]|uniref:DnaB-like helicase N terminal domain-containing protein n=1 Tax=Dehalogenimonas formicexedens TaxID=1839801 RepID=A0A1P8F629_9CHLR|nr:DnaB-like helicase N-terminal domain-containing protein [Dehalogenimonas formicexedens]APV43885.1 DnaB-like helicase N terminal domain-containing protein [Dehalogenimonas formicexedens]